MLCRQLNARAALARCLGNQAIVLRARGDEAGAMDLTVASGALFREIGDPAGLSLAIVGRATLLSDRPGQKSAAVGLARQALDIASTHGLKDIATRLAQVIQLIEEKQS